MHNISKTQKFKLIDSNRSSYCCIVSILWDNHASLELLQVVLALTGKVFGGSHLEFAAKLPQLIESTHVWL